MKIIRTMAACVCYAIAFVLLIGCVSYRFAHLTLTEAQAFLELWPQWLGVFVFATTGSLIENYTK